MTFSVVLCGSVPALAALIGLGGVLVTLYINGQRLARGRRRDLHGRGIRAALAYLEMPYAIRRRRHEAEHRSAERVRLTERFADVQAELAACQALIRADGQTEVAHAYDRLVETMRKIAGAEAARAWSEDPVQRDDQMGMGALHSTLEVVRKEKDRFVDIASEATQPWWGRQRRIGQAANSARRAPAQPGPG
jgi:hypothetical protein